MDALSQLPPPAPHRPAWPAMLLAAAAVTLLSLLCLAHERTFFWHCDAQLFFTPHYTDIARAWHHGEWPLLSQGNWTAGHLGGEYQLGTFSLFHNVYLLAVYALPLSLPGQAAAFSIVHLALLAAGTALLARQRGVPTPFAVGAALGAAGNGWLINWAASQWVPTLTGFTWVPWCWWAFERALASNSARERWLLPVPFLYLALTAGHPFTVLMLGIVTVWLVARECAATHRLTAVGPLLTAWLLGLALSAPAWLLLLEYQRYTIRGEWGLMLQWAWTVPWRAWLAVGLPAYTTLWRDFWERLMPHYGIEMAGALIPAAALLTMLGAHRRRLWERWRWPLGLLVVIMFLASVPLVGSFRWSYRFLPLFHLALALWGAEWLAELSPRQVASRALLLAGGATAVAVVTSANASMVLAVGQGVVLLAWWAVARWGSGGWLAWAPASVTGALLLVTYSCLSTTQSAFFHPFGENLRAPGVLQRERLYLGVYGFNDLVAAQSAPAGWGALLRPGNTALLADLHFLNGYSSFNAYGIPALFQPFGSLAPEMAESLLSPACAGLLELLGVDGLVFGPLEFALADQLGAEWKLIHRSEEARVYHREPARAASVKALAVLENQQALSVPHLQVVSEGRQRVVVEVEPASTGGQSIDAMEDIGVVADPGVEVARVLPSVLVFRRPYYPGYRAWLNGRPLSVQVYGGVVPMVELPAGVRGRVELRYWPWSLSAGLTASGGGLLCLAFLFWRLRPAKLVGRKLTGDSVTQGKAD